MGATSSTEKLQYQNLSKEEVNSARRLFSEQGKGKSVVSSGLQESLMSCRDQKNKSLSADQLIGVLDKLFGDSADQSEALLCIYKDPHKMLHSIVQTFASQEKMSDEETSRLEEYLKRNQTGAVDRWLTAQPLASQISQFVHSPLCSRQQPKLFPSLNGQTKLLQSKGSLAVLNACLPMERRMNWSLLFNSGMHGSSFSQLCDRINGEGPMILVVESTNDHVFGCFASDGFICGPKYRGDATCFLFQLKPSLAVYSATGRSPNYAYLNTQQSTLVNGLGMGGYESSWPFFLEEDFGTGKTFPNMSSFEKCCLSGEKTFEIRHIEAWRVGEKPRLNEEEAEYIRSSKSIIDKDPEVKAMLEMAGRPLQSDAYRDPKPILGEDED